MITVGIFECVLNYSLHKVGVLLWNTVLDWQQ